VNDRIYYITNLFSNVTKVFRDVRKWHITVVNELSKQLISFFINKKLLIMTQTINFPKKIHEVSEFFGTAIPYMSDPLNLTRWGFLPAKVKAVNDLKDLFDPNRDKYLDPRQKTTFITKDNNKYIAEIKVELNIIVADIPNSKLSDDDRRILRIIEKGKGSRIPIVTFGPKIGIASTAYLQMTIEFANPTTPGSRAMPYGHGLIFEDFIGEPGLADADIVFSNSVNVTNAKLIFSFTEAQVGKTCYMRCRYENRHHERGPSSIIISKVIA